METNDLINFIDQNTGECVGVLDGVVLYTETNWNLDPSADAQAFRNAVYAVLPNGPSIRVFQCEDWPNNATAIPVKF